MDFGLSEEQQMIVDTTRAFVEAELYPHEMMVERTGHLPMELIKEIQSKAMAAGLYAANMPAEVGGAGLDTLTWLLYEKELGRANYALHWTCVARPSNILLAGNEEQRQQYLYPCIRGETWDCLAMTEPGAGSDLRGMKATARQEGDDWVLNGTKHFISHADIAGFAIVFMATGEEQTPRGPKKQITAFFVDKGTKGFSVRDGYRNVSHRGYTNAVLEFDDCRLNRRQILGDVHKGFEVANSWLGATRLQVASTCLGRAERAMAHAVSFIAEGVFEKFPGLKVLFDECDQFWAVGLMWHMDADWKSLRDQTPWLKKLPSEYFRGHIRVGTQPMLEPETNEQFWMMLEALHADETLVYSSDWPHWDWDDPASTFPKLPEQLHRRVFAENARELFGL